MVLDSGPVEFVVWFWQACLFFLQAAAILGLVALVSGYLVVAFRYGPIGGGDVTYRMLKNAGRDLISFSPRRILALAWLAVQESLRRRVLVGFAVFILILLFAGWFLDTRSTDPAALYLSFVLTATTYLVLLMALFLSAFSLPADIKNHTIYTIVTKPVRPGEIVLGRILGFSAIGTVLLAVMGLFSYVFVVRVLNHTHTVDVASLKAAGGTNSDDRVGRTSLAQNHRHQVTIHADGTGATDIAQGHYHEIDAVVDGDKTTYVVGPPKDLFTARVPAYGKLRFKDRAGQGRDRGINVGNEWKYRSFVEG
ncbi:MAG TPA: ABC transporter permease, partial [Pirellulales bacterium]|nr:ABC transporter permease [Pirellulales bacterium]